MLLYAFLSYFPSTQERVITDTAAPPCCLLPIIHISSPSSLLPFLLVSSGGWDKDDHEEFVRIARSFRGDYTQAVAVCMERVVGFSRSEAMDHARWHMEYWSGGFRPSISHLSLGWGGVWASPKSGVQQHASSSN